MTSLTLLLVVSLSFQLSSASPKPPSVPDITAAIRFNMDDSLYADEEDQHTGVASLMGEGGDVSGASLKEKRGVRTRRSPVIVEAASMPYSSGRMRSFPTSRYRYPINRKRSSRIAAYKQSDEPMLGLYQDYPEERLAAESYAMMRPSLFRERTVHNGPEEKESFFDEPFPSKDLHAGTVDSEDYAEEPTYGFLNEDEAEPFFDDSAMKPKLMSYYRSLLQGLRDARQRQMIRNEKLEAEEMQLLKELMERTTAKLGINDGDDNDAYTIVGAKFEGINPLIRSKRESKNDQHEEQWVRMMENSSDPHSMAMRNSLATLLKNRTKRANKSPVENRVQELKRRKKSYLPYQNEKDVLDDLLAREYFKTIAQNVGDKKKRSRYAGELSKRAPLENILNDPRVLDMMEQKLKEAERDLMVETEETIFKEHPKHPKTDKGELDHFFRNSLTRLEAIHRMLGAVEELRMLQEAEAKENSGKYSHPRSMHPHSNSNEERKKKDFRGNPLYPLLEKISQASYAECPALEQMTLNCEELSEIVGDSGNLFVPACLTHEVCYMCGAEVGADASNCDTMLVASLMGACDDTAACISSATEMKSVLVSNNRFDPNGTCAHVPCIRSIMESRKKR